MKILKKIEDWFYGKFFIPQIYLPKKRKPKIRKCFVTNKYMFTEQIAKDKATFFKKKNTHMRAYCCEFCGSWHLTHQRRYKW